MALPLQAAAPDTKIPAAGPGKAAIASAYPLASEAGKQILAKGGNAFDAAVAVAAALAVVEPSSSGLGGGGFFLLRRASDGHETMIDLREMAPGAATRDMYLDKDGNVVAGPVARFRARRGNSGRAGRPRVSREEVRQVAAGGEHGAGDQARARRVSAVRAPARRHARSRRTRSSRRPTRRACTWSTARCPRSATSSSSPSSPPASSCSPRKGADGFYKGAFAKKLVAGVQQLGGNWTEADLANYKVVERAPVVGHYRGARIVSGSPPTSGGIALIDALNILEGFDLAKVDKVTRTHLIVEAMRRVHRDRAVYLGDPDFVDVPVARLINEYYAAGQRASIRMDHATPSAMLPGVDAAPAGPSTTHFSVLDKHGNMVAATITLNFFFGSGLMVPGTGILLNNQMDDFSAKPGVPNGFQLIGADANAIAPKKRPLSSSTPTFVEGPEGLDDHRFARRQPHSRHGASSARSISWTARTRRRSSRRRASITSSRPTCCSSSPER